MIADKIRNMKHGGDRKGEAFKLQVCDLKNGAAPMSLTQAAKMMNVSTRSRERFTGR
jgi:hypothetical protein